MGNKNMRFGQYAKYIRLIEHRHHGNTIRSYSEERDGCMYMYYEEIPWEESYNKAKKILVPWDYK